MDFTQMYRHTDWLIYRQTNGHKKSKYLKQKTLSILNVGPLDTDAVFSSYKIKQITITIAIITISISITFKYQC